MVKFLYLFAAVFLQCQVYALNSVDAGYENRLSKDYTLYGDFMKLNPTGAGSRTSQGTGTTGVAASQVLAKLHLSAIQKYWNDFVVTAQNTGIDPALIAGLASRESNVGDSLCREGWGDCRAPNCTECHAWGILQCDIYTSDIRKECRKYNAYSQELMQLSIGTELIGKIKCVQNKMKTWKKEQQLQGGVAAYNYGCSNVRSWENLDKGSANGDYSNDVIARAQWIKRQFAFKNKNTL